MARYGKAAGKSVKSAARSVQAKAARAAKCPAASKRLRLDFLRRGRRAPRYRGKSLNAILGRICNSSLAIKAAIFAALVAGDPSC